MYKSVEESALPETPRGTYLKPVLTPLPFLTSVYIALIYGILYLCFVAYPIGQCLKGGRGNDTSDTTWTVSKTDANPCTL